jgi:hypothetical protein
MLIYYISYQAIFNQSVRKFINMKKGFLKLNIIAVESDYYINKDYFLKLKTEKASFNMPSKDLKIYNTQ